ncbi:MAG: YkgJ family cysteine cluster protein [Desulfobacterales bacterium]|nr:YkgJ family cysteine cluster protein [Desulfobacterales bacterium]
MEEDIVQIMPDEPFIFACHSGVACFNECCRDLNQFITPYDMVRMRKSLGLSCEEFLSKYTSRHIGPESGLPVVTLKPNPADGLTCPFVTPEGCSVYNDRPASCRMYPLARAVTRSRETGQLMEHFALIRESHCKGFSEGKSQTPLEWVENQGLKKYNEMNDLLLEIISLKNQKKSGPVDFKEELMVHMAFYDLDSFRTHIFEKGLLGEFNLDERIMEKIKTDDVELLKLGFEWIKRVLFT